MAREEKAPSVLLGRYLITSGMKAQYLTTAVRTGAPGMRGVSLLLVDCAAPGVHASRMKTQGWWSSTTAHIVLRNVRVPCRNLIGEENGGFQSIMVRGGGSCTHECAVGLCWYKKVGTKSSNLVVARMAVNAIFLGMSLSKSSLFDCATLAQLQPGAVRVRCDEHALRAGVPGRRRRVCAQPQDIRQATGGAPSHPTQGGQHGNACAAVPRHARTGRPTLLSRPWEICCVQVCYMMEQQLPVKAVAGPVALTKVLATQCMEFCAREATQIFGGRACVRGGRAAKVERLYREVRVNAIAGGSEEILIDLAMRQAQL